MRNVTKVKMRFLVAFIVMMSRLGDTKTKIDFLKSDVQKWILFFSFFYRDLHWELSSEWWYISLLLPVSPVCFLIELCCRIQLCFLWRDKAGWAGCDPAGRAGTACLSWSCWLAGHVWDDVATKYRILTPADCSPTSQSLSPLITK